MYYRPIKKVFIINGVHNIECIFHTYTGYWTRTWPTKLNHAPQVVLTIKYNDGQERIRHVTFKENIKVISNMSNINYEQFVHQVCRVVPKTNKFFVRYICPNLNTQELYKMYFQYMKQIIGQCGA